MTMITLDNQISEENTLLGDARAALQLLREEIHSLTQRLAEGDKTDLASANPDIKRLNILYTTCIETENRLAKSRETKAGIAQNGVAFDLAEARDSIGRKLDRLRNAQTAA